MQAASPWSSDVSSDMREEVSPSDMLCAAAAGQFPPADAVRAKGVDGYGSALSPEFLLWLAGDGGHVGCQDAVLLSYGTSGRGLPRQDHLDDHPRVRHARTLRSRFEVYGDETGFVTIGIGLGGLTELSVELTADHGRGYGRLLIRRALELVGPPEVVVAQVTPGNARSLRAFLATGFVPVGSAVAISWRPEPSSP